MTGFRRLGSPLYSLRICGGFPYPSPRRSPDRKTLSPSRHWTIFPSFPESARTAALSPFHNVRAVAHEFKFECPFEVPHALFFLIGSAVGNFSRCWRLRQRLWSRPPFWSQRVLNDLPLTVKKVVNHLEEIHIVHPNCLHYSQLPCLFPYRKTSLTLRLHFF